MPEGGLRNNVISNVYQTQARRLELHLNKPLPATPTANKQQNTGNGEQATAEQATAEQATAKKQRQRSNS
jgi:hypothetical protein